MERLIFLQMCIRDRDADETAETTATGKKPQYLTIDSIQIIDNGQLQDDGVSGNDTAIYQGTNWYYDSTKNQLVLDLSLIHISIVPLSGVHLQSGSVVWGLSYFCLRSCL